MYLNKFLPMALLTSVALPPILPSQGQPGNSHQRGCKVVTSGTSVKMKFFSYDVYTIFIHSFGTSTTKTRSGGYLGHGEEGIGGKELLALTL